MRRVGDKLGKGETKDFLSNDIMLLYLTQNTAGSKHDETYSEETSSPTFYR